MPSEKHAPEVSVVVPVYNEEDNVRPLVDGIARAMKPLGRAFEIVVVDDGSTDGTRKILEEEARIRPELVVVKLRSHAGQTAAFEAGFRSASGATLVTLDGDLQYDPGDIPALLEATRNHDVVCGIRAHRRDTAWKRLCSRTANGVRRRLTGDPVRDIGCSLKVFPREAILRVRLFDGMHRFFPTLLRMEGCSIAEIPVKHFERRHGKSKYSARNRMFSALFDCLLVRWMQRRRLHYEVEP